MTVTGQIVYAIPRKALIVLFWRRAVTRRRFVFLVGLFLALGIIVMLTNDDFRSAGVLLVLYAVLLPVFAYLGASRSVNQPSLLESKTLTFDANGLELSGSDWSSRRSWRHFKGWSEDAKHFYLDAIPNDIAATVIPKSAMSESQRELLRHYLKSVASSS
jgi:hypothetical protein